MGQILFLCNFVQFRRPSAVFCQLLVSARGNWVEMQSDNSCDVMVLSVLNFVGLD